MKLTHHKQQSSRLPGTVLLVLGVATTTFACSGEVVVGSPGSSGGASNGSGGSSDTSVGSGGDDSEDTNQVDSSGGDGDAVNTDCSEIDAERKSDYTAWHEQANVWGELAGKTFTGYVEGVIDDLRLSIDEDGAAVLTIGEPAAAPVKEIGYLCEKATCNLLSSDSILPGGTYEIHSALVESGRVRINLGSPFDPWCALQDPVDNDEPGHCLFGLMGNDDISYQPNGEVCWIGSSATPVDCGWFFLANFGVCTCTSQECFSFAGSKIDARIDENGDIVGTLWDGTLYLFAEE